MADMEADIPAGDRGETVASMEPLLLSESYRRRARIADLAIDLARESAALRRGVPANLIGPLSDLVRSMNCYYSNLIEGHDTHPVDIERALAGDYSNDSRSAKPERISKCSGGSMVVDWTRLRP